MLGGLGQRPAAARHNSKARAFANGDICFSGNDFCGARTKQLLAQLNRLAPGDHLNSCRYRIERGSCILVQSVESIELREVLRRHRRQIAACCAKELHVGAQRTDVAAPASQAVLLDLESLELLAQPRELYGTGDIGLL